MHGAIVTAAPTNSMFLASVSHPPNGDPQRLARHVAEALGEAKVVYVQPADGWQETAAALYEGLAAQVSRILDPDRSEPPWGALPRERWIEVKSDPSRADRDRRRPLHNDEAAIGAPAHVLLMYCERAATRGGGNVFLDVADVVAELERADPDLLLELARRPIRFSRKGDSRTAPVIGRRDGMPTANWDEGALDETQDAGALELAARFSDVLEGDGLTRRLHLLDLAEGEAMLWWDDLVLHGRAPVEAGGESRYFRKTGIVLGTLDSTAVAGAT